MGSMKKRKTEKEVEKFVKTHGQELLVSEKLDGISCLMEINMDFKQINLYTRGKGAEGQDISFMRHVINIFNSESYKNIVKSKLYIRGEIVA